MTKTSLAHKPINNNTTEPKNLLDAHFSEISERDRKGKPYKHLLQQTVKPCVARYLSGEYEPEPGMRNKQFYAIAADLRRAGLTEEAALSELKEYYYRLQGMEKRHGKHRKPFTYGEVIGVVRGTFKTEVVKSYGCHRTPLKDACTGSSCIFRRQIQGEKDKATFTASTLKAVAYLAPALTASELKIYIGLLTIEHENKHHPGELYAVTYDRISQAAGVSKCVIKKTLLRLKERGLIEFNVGESGRGKPSGMPSEIRRVIPIPSSST